MTNATKISKAKNKKYTPNMDLLDSYSDITEHVPAPMVALFEFDSKKLVYCGTAHDNDISVKTINKCFEDFDIDILFYGNEIINLPELTIPHYKMHERAFVLVPLLELIPLFKHPLLNKSITELHENIEEPEDVFLYGTVKIWK